MWQSWAQQPPRLSTLSHLSLRRKKTQSRSPPSESGKGPLQWGLTVTEAVPAPPSVVHQRLTEAGEIAGEQPVPIPKLSRGEGRAASFSAA